MKTTAQLLAGMCALILVACASETDTPGSAQVNFEADGSVCGPQFKIDEPGPQDHIQCPKGEMVARICVKAGPDCHCSDRDSGCYTFEGVGTRSGSVSGGGTGRDCKDISNTQFDCEPAPPPACPPDQKPCETDKDCGADPEICVKGCCAPGK